MKKQLIGAAAALVMLPAAAAVQRYPDQDLYDRIRGQEVKIVMTAEDEIVKTFTISAGVNWRGN
ncbi:MAG: hypothetical protein ACLVJ6_02535 [Merdibacter sp.]